MKKYRFFYIFVYYAILKTALNSSIILYEGKPSQKYGIAENEKR